MGRPVAPPQQGDGPRMARQLRHVDGPHTACHRRGEQRVAEAGRGQLAEGLEAADLGDRVGKQASAGKQFVDERAKAGAAGKQAQWAAGKVGQRHPLGCLGRTHGDDGIPVERQGIQPVIHGRCRHKSGIHLARQNPRRCGGAVPDQHAEAQVRTGGPQPSHRPWQQRQGKRCPAPQPQRQRPLGAHAGQHGVPVLRLAHGPGREGLTGRSEGHTPPAALQQGRAGRPGQPLDLPGQGRLRKVTAFGRCGDRAGVTDGREGEQRLDIHASSTS